MKRSTVDLVFSEGLQVLDRVLVWPGLLQSVGQFHQSAMDFKLSRKPPSPFDGCVGALDGISAKIRNPIEVPSAECYCRKGFYALSVQALVDAHYKFIFMSCLFPGSTHDSIAYRARS